MNSKRVKIKQIHLENDVSRTKLLEDSVNINFNRANVPLVEIVTEPCFFSAFDAICFLNWLKKVLIIEKVYENDIGNIF